MSDGIDRFRCDHCKEFFTADQTTHRHSVYYPGYGDTHERVFGPDIADLTATIAVLLDRIANLDLQVSGLQHRAAELDHRTRGSIVFGVER